VVLPQGCEVISVTDCANSRGELFNTTASKTWKDLGPFSLGFEDALGFSDNGEFGYETGMANSSPKMANDAHINLKL
jgi:hypothetical protein